MVLHDMRHDTGCVYTACVCVYSDVAMATVKSGDII